MGANANSYSIGGSVELAANVATGTNTSYSSNVLVDAVTGNSINTFFFGSTPNAAATMAGLLAYGVLGSILMLVNGHAVNHPEVVVPRLEAVILIMFFAAAAALSFTFTKHKLTRPTASHCLLSFCVFSGRQ